jgi:hypothetical protein
MTEVILVQIIADRFGNWAAHASLTRHEEASVTWVGHGPRRGMAIPTGLLGVVSFYEARLIAEAFNKNALDPYVFDERMPEPERAMWASIWQAVAGAALHGDEP